MAQIAIGHEAYEALWTSDVDFDGIRLEVFTNEGVLWFDVSVPETGAIEVNTFSHSVPADLIAAAVELAKRR